MNESKKSKLHRRTKEKKKRKFLTILNLKKKKKQNMVKKIKIEKDCKKERKLGSERTKEI